MRQEAGRPHSIFLIVFKLALLCVAMAGVILIADVVGLIAYGYIIGKVWFQVEPFPTSYLLRQL
jgi:hypothetical protein